MAAYNHADFIADSIQSVLKQSYSDIELIVVDDGSPDNTADVIRTEAETDSRVKPLFFQKNQGACKATAYAISQCSSEFIAIINSDDTWQPDKLEKQLEFLQQNSNVGAVFSRVNTIDDSGQKIQSRLADVFNKPENRSRFDWLNRFFFDGNCLCHPSMLIRRECYEKAGGVYRLYLSGVPDYDMWVRLCLTTEIHILDEPLVNFRVLNSGANESSPSLANKIRSANEMPVVLQNYLSIDLKTFEAVFPQAPKPKFTELIPYYVAMQALDVDTPWHKSFAVSAILALMQKPEGIQKLEEEGVSLASIYSLIKQVDSYSLGAHKKLKKTKRLYGRLFVISLLVAFGLLIARFF